MRMVVVWKWEWGHLHTNLLVNSVSFPLSLHQLLEDRVLGGTVFAERVKEELNLNVLGVGTGSPAWEPAIDGARVCSHRDYLSLII